MSTTTTQAGSEWARELVSIHDAARAVRKRFTYVKDLVDRGEVRAWKAAEGEKLVRLRVRVRDVEAAIRRLTVYEPPKAKRGRRPSRPEPQAVPASVHRFVKC